MKVNKTKNNLIVKSRYFSAEQTLNCGQVFRFSPLKDGYTLCAGKEFANIATYGDETHIYCTDENYFYNYFDLDTDYSQIVAALQKIPFLEKAVNYGKGIRILRQEKLETIISFILSANNNIKRIKGIIENICRELGEKRVFGGIEYYGFPSTDKLAAADEDFFIKAGAGYRAKYLTETIKAVAGGFDIEAISSMDTSAAEKTLMGLYGVGKKVADCILIFAYGKKDVFPVDTWIQKAYCSDIARGSDVNISRETMSERLCGMFGSLSGYAQQYLFYYKRENPDINKIISRG
jgi:N-glycosylase/DNA lyase